jgi:hypothetical protein
MKNRAVTIVNARRFDFVSVAGAEITDIEVMRFLAVNSHGDAIAGEHVG